MNILRIIAHIIFVYIPAFLFHVLILTAIVKQDKSKAFYKEDGKGQ